MSSQTSLPEAPRQLLPPEAYTSEAWFAAEKKELLGEAWTYAGVTTDFAAPGDYAALYAGDYPLAVVCDGEGELRAYHNLCSHRGTEILEGRGNAGPALICPYHKWSFGLDGALRGVPDRAECFPDMDDGEFALQKAALAVFRGVVFVHPDPKAGSSFAGWLADLPEHAWPHDIGDLVGGETITYEMNCNWKVYYENAIDGYHLAYLHNNTLGGPAPSKNVWDPHGPHLVWYSTELEGRKTSMTQHMVTGLEGRGLDKIEGAENSDYGGVYMLFPTTIVSPKPYGIYISQLVPLKPDLTLLTSRKWNLKGERDDWAAREWDGALSALDEKSGRIKLELLDCHPLESGAFRMEDIWICEKMQRALGSPNYSVGALARGDGAESPIAFFQQAVLDAMSETPL